MVQEDFIEHVQRMFNSLSVLFVWIKYIVFNNETFFPFV